VVAWCLSGCPSHDTQPSHGQEGLPDAPPPSAPEHAPAPSSTRDGDGAVGTNAADAGANAWRQVSRKDDLPVCLFPNWLEWQKAEFMHQVKPSASLRVGHAIHFGVYGPGCAAPECVRDPALQCWTEIEGNVVTLHTRYSAFENPEATCTSDCLAVYAQCNTPQLGKGEYVVVYGDDKWKVRVPSVVRPACRKH
jgi:hypothetical protein